MKNMIYLEESRLWINLDQISTIEDGEGPMMVYMTNGRPESIDDDIEREQITEALKARMV